MNHCHLCSNEMIEVVEEQQQIYHGYAGKIATKKRECSVCGAVGYEFIPIATKIKNCIEGLINFKK